MELCQGLFKVEVLKDGFDVVGKPVQIIREVVTEAFCGEGVQAKATGIVEGEMGLRTDTRGNKGVWSPLKLLADDGHLADVGLHDAFDAAQHSKGQNDLAIIALFIGAAQAVCDVPNHVRKVSGCRGGHGRIVRRAEMVVYQMKECVLYCKVRFKLSSDS